MILPSICWGCGKPFEGKEHQFREREFGIPLITCPEIPKGRLYLMEPDFVILCPTDVKWTTKETG